MQAYPGISPIAWWNDDLKELSEEISLGECLRQCRAAGFLGVENGRRFPQTPAGLLPVLATAGLRICGGWFSGRLLDGDLEEEKDRIFPQLALFREAGAPCMTYGETAGSIQGLRARPIATKRVLSEDEMRSYGRRLTAFAEWCAGEGMPLSYHHHMGAVVQTGPEIDALLRHSGPALPLLYDTGHLVLAGADPLEILDRHHARINQVHLKDVRTPLLRTVDPRRDSFLDAVVRGVFTVPGDGDLAFPPILERLAAHGYEGWFILEAEQDPRHSPPERMAQLGGATLVRLLRDAGYSVVQHPPSQPDC